MTINSMGFAWTVPFLRSATARAPRGRGASFCKRANHRIGFMMAGILMALAAGASSTSMAQPATASAPSGAADPQAPVSPLIYLSPFARYQLFAEPESKSWKSVNDEVGRIGGWKAYAREAHETSAPGKSGEAPANAPPNASQPAPDGAARAR